MKGLRGHLGLDLHDWKPYFYPAAQFHLFPHDDASCLNAVEVPYSCEAWHQKLLNDWIAATSRFKLP